MAEHDTAATSDEPSGGADSDRAYAFLRFRRTAIVYGAFAFAFACCFMAATLARFDIFDVPTVYMQLSLRLLPLIVLLKLVTFRFAGVLRSSMRYLRVVDLVWLGGSVLTCSVLLLLLRLILIHAPGSRLTLPLGIIVLDGFISMAAAGMLRSALPMVFELKARLRRRSNVQGRTLIIGAGEAGELLLTRMHHATTMAKHVAVGFVDDDPRKRGKRIGGVPVYGPLDNVSHIATQLSANMAVLAMPNASAAEMRRAVLLLQRARIPFVTVPGIDELLAGRSRVDQVRDVTIEDLLDREMVTLDAEAMAAHIRRKTVLVTGAAGSIGSELCRQMLNFEPERLVLLDQAETPLFFLERELKRKNHQHTGLSPVVADITRSGQIAQVFDEFRPQVVYHAAAYKHVPLMETNCSAAILNNVLGTAVVANVANRLGVESFVMISTDKAVNPTSIMGLTKRLAEVYIQALDTVSPVEYITVRFGNVLGSAGSVIPIFRGQIASGGPITITHPDMQRYFMTIPEASQLVLQAGAIGDGGEVFLLQMGLPVKIVELARTMVELAGLEIDKEIRIEFTGIRPGEKLFEELRCDGEDLSPTRHPRVFVWRCRQFPWEAVKEQISRLTESPLTDGTFAGVVQTLVPEYAGNLNAL
jgi:FlaA1/EpsC-like NDP-sugar epimerase